MDETDQGTAVAAAVYYPGKARLPELATRDNEVAY